MFDIPELAPKDGYILPNWGRNNAFRATAIAYLQQEELYTVENKDGKWYTLCELKLARLGNNAKNQN